MATQPFIDIPFGPYLPDLGGAPSPEMPGYLVDAVGVRLTPNGYRGLPKSELIALTTAAVGAATTYMYGWYFDTASLNIYFAFDVSDGNIYQSNDYGITWTDVSPAAGTLDYTFTLFRYDSDVIIASALRAPAKKTLTAAVGTLFADLAGSPPTASYGAQVRQHAVLGNLSTDSYAVRWSAIGNHEDWPTPGTADALAKQAGTQRLPLQLGVVKGVLGGEKIGIVVQEGGLTRMTYIGDNEVYAFDTYESVQGYGRRRRCRFATDGNIWYWYDDFGFYATDGYSVNSLSEGKISDSIFADLISHPNGGSIGSAADGFAVFDPHRRLVIAGCENKDYQLCYDPRLGSFTWMNESDLYCLLYGGVNTGDVVDFPRAVGMFSQADRKLYTLTNTGAALAMQTGFIEIDPGYRVQLQGAHLIGANGIGSLTLAYKTADDFTTMGVSQSGFTSLTAASRGMKQQARAASQFFSFRVTGTGAEAQLLRGIRVYYSRVEQSA